MHPIPVTIAIAIGRFERTLPTHAGRVPLAVTVPWVGAELAASGEILGHEVWPYGIEENRREIEILLRYSVEQGIIEQTVEVDALFAPAILAGARI